MPGIAGNVHHGARRHVRLVREDDFGQVPGAPTWVDVPILGDGMKLKATSEPYSPDTNFGGFVDQRIAIQHKLDVAGGLTTLLWPQIAKALLDMALERDAANGDDLYSYSFDHYTPADPRRYRGVVAETLRLSVSGTGDAETQISLDLRGQDEAENNTLAPADFDYSAIDLRPFMGPDATVEIDTVASFDVETWTLTVENTVAQGPYIRKVGIHHSVVCYLIAGRRRISLELTRVNRQDEFNDAIRSATDISFEANFRHPEGHILQLQLPKLVVPASEEDGTPSQVAKESPRLIAVANAAGNALVYGVDLAAGGTTTLAPLTTTEGPTTEAPTTEAPTTTTPGA